LNDSIKVIPAQDKKVYGLSNGVIYYVGKNEYLDQVVVVKYDEAYMIYAKLVDMKEYNKKGLKVSKVMILGETDIELVF